MRKSKLFALLLASIVLMYTGCSEKETPQPVEDTARTSALRQELAALQLQVLGVQLDNATLTADAASIEEQIAALEEAIAALEAIYSQQTTYSVQVFDFQGSVIAGASVTVNENGAIATKATNANGVATFERVRAGAIVGVVSAPGFATANYQASLYNAGGEFGATTRIALLPKGGNAQADAGLFTLKGYLYANFDAVDDTIGGISVVTDPSDPEDILTVNIVNFTGNRGEVQGPYSSRPHRSYDKVTKKMTAMLHIDLDYVPFTNDWLNGNGSETNGGGNAQIMRIAYENATYEATFDATTKQYSIKLPAFSDFMAGYFATNSNIEWDEDADGEWTTQWYYKFTFDEFTATARLIDKADVATVNDQYDATVQHSGISGDQCTTWKNLVDMNYNSAALKTYNQQFVYRINDVFTNSYTMGYAEQVLPGSTYQGSWSNFFYEPFRIF